MSVGIIAADSKITMHFALKIDDEQIVDSTFERSPVNFVWVMAICCRVLKSIYWA